ncbi:MAG: PspC domain-containing protein [Flavobacteriales bacterium]|nr:PspC domain-containing protein [Flavobacteriales bacterium]
MNQTVTANISGIVFHIEIDAYDKLKNYLSEIKKRFEVAEEREEIMLDIEARIAEVFKSKLNEQNQVISMPHVDEVISLMGQPEDFAGQSEEESKTTSQQEFKTGKRIYRSGEDKILAGVCSGIAAYFGFDPIWLRLVFAIAFFVFGFGFPLYIILWIIIPEAKTRAQKLEMRGEPVNIDNIEKTIKKEAEEFSNRVKDWEKEGGAKKLENMIKNFVEFIISIFTLFIKTFAKILGALFLFIGLLLLTALITSAFDLKTITIDGYNISIFTVEDFANAFFENSEQYTLALIALFFIVMAPIFTFIYSGLKLLLKIKSNHKIISLALFIFFTTGIILSIIVGILVSSEFKREAVATKVYKIKNHDVLYIDILNVDKNSFIINGKVKNIKPFYFTEDSIFYSYPELNILQATGDSAYIEISKSAKGILQKEAEIRAENIKYNFYQKDSTLYFNQYFSSHKEDKIRGQKVHITLYLPINYAVHFTKNSKKIIYDVENVTNTHDLKMINHTWVMLEKGLTCVACEKIKGLSMQELQKLQLPKDTVNEKIISTP